MTLDELLKEMRDVVLDATPADLDAAKLRYDELQKKARARLDLEGGHVASMRRVRRRHHPKCPRSSPEGCVLDDACTCDRLEARAVVEQLIAEERARLLGVLEHRWLTLLGARSFSVSCN